MIKPNPKDPVWIVRYQNVISQAMSPIVGPDGKPVALRTEYGPEDEITAHGKDEEAARAYVEQQNPGIKILSAEKVKV